MLQAFDSTASSASALIAMHCVAHGARACAQRPITHSACSPASSQAAKNTRTSHSARPLKANGSQRLATSKAKVARGMPVISTLHNRVTDIPPGSRAGCCRRRLASQYSRPLASITQPLMPAKKYRARKPG
ncbi:hypothetical protein D3C79_763580 [compost metagenome]